MGKRTSVTIWLLVALMLAGICWIGYRGIQREHLRQPLLVAVGAQNAAEVQRLLDAGADPNARDMVLMQRTAWQTFLDSLLSLRRHRHTPLEIGPTALMIACAGERVMPAPNDDCWKTPGLCTGGTAGRDDPTTVRLLLDHGALVNAKGERGWTALMAATTTEQSRIMRILLQRGAQPDQRYYMPGSDNAIGDTPLLRAISFFCRDRTTGYRRITDYRAAALVLIAAGADVNAVGDESTPLEEAVTSGDTGLVRLLLAKGAWINALPRYAGLNSTPLAAAAGQGDLPMAQFLLGQGADINAEPRACFTPLAASACYGKDKMLRYLVMQKAAANAPSADGNTALIWASIKGNAAIIAFLLAHGANANVVNHAGHTALMFAPDTVIIQMLLRGSPSQKAKDTALAHTASWGNLQAARLLLKAGANPNSVDESGKTALGEAATPGYYRGESTVSVMANLLLAHGANVNQADREGRTALMDGVYYPSLLRILLRHGADVNARDHEGRTALIEATANPMPNHAELLHLLLSHGAKLKMEDKEGDTALSLAMSYASDYPAAKIVLEQAQKKEK